MAGTNGLASAALIWKKRAETALEEQSADFVTSDMVYVMFSTVMIFMITPGISLYYSGVLRRKNVVQLLFQSYMTTNTVTILWYLLGYSLAISPTSTSKLIGNFHNAALHAEEAKGLYDGATIPSVINFCFNTFFPVATVQIFVGAIGERGRFIPSQVIAVIWTIVVYCPFAFWVWGLNGWLLNLGALDFAGGGPVHIASGVASIVYSRFLGKRQEWKRVNGPPHYRGYSAISTFIGVTLIWAAWFCFNTGTLLSVNVRTGYIFVNTLLASTFASMTYTLVDFAMTGKWSMHAACDGVIAGLVNITPSCGFVYPWGAAVSAIITAAICRLLLNFNKWISVDDYSYSGVIHGIGGISGAVWTGIFASKTVAGFDGVTDIPGGWIDGHYVQLGYQLAGVCAIVLWTIVFTTIILIIVDKIPGCKLRASEEAEEMGMDLYEMAETLDEFGNDYDEFFQKYAQQLRSIADSIESKHGSVEVLTGSSPRGDDNSVEMINLNTHEKV